MQMYKALRRPKSWKSFAPIFIPTLVIGALVLGMVITLALATYSINLQMTSNTRVLNYNISDQSRVFVQLQREALKLNILLANDTTALDADEVNLQYQLLLSRIERLNVSIMDQSVPMPDEIYEEAQAISETWETIHTPIDRLMTDLGNVELRTEVIAHLRDFEILTNTTEIQYNRARAVTLANFAEVSRQLPSTFSVITGLMLAVMVTVLIGLYVYIRQVQRAEAARQSNHFKDQFLAVMSHELRTPLNAMIGFLGIIKMGGGLPEKTAYMIDRVRENAERLLMLINDILDLSKIEAQRFEINVEPVPMRDLAARWKAQNDVLAAQKGLTFKLEIDPSCPDIVYTDSDALTKIVVNLLSNAFKFTKKGEVTLDLRSTPAGLEIRISDTGIGIPEDKQKLVFESFQQVDSSIRRSYGGTGLGLTIVRSLTQLMNGSVALKSQVGVGSTFTVTLPLQSPPEVDVESSAPTPVLTR